MSTFPQTTNISSGSYILLWNPSQKLAKDIVMIEASQFIAGLGLSTGSTPGNELDPVIAQQNAPAVGPTTGDRYLVGTSPSGAWIGHANQIAEWNGTTWVYTVPVTDNIVYVTSSLTTLQYNGTVWGTYPGTAILQNGNTLTTAVNIGSRNAQALQFKTNNVNRALFTAAGQFNVSGNIYVGNLTSTATAKIHIRGVDATSSNFGLRIDNSAASPLFVVRNDGNVGIGLSSALLGYVHIKGKADEKQLVIQANTTQNIANPLIWIIDSTGVELIRIHSDNIVNTFVGYRSGQNNVFSGGGGFDNTAFGSDTLQQNTTGQTNTAIGKRSMATNVSGNYNTAIGAGALLLNATSNYSVAIGYHAAMASTVGDQVAIGANALLNTTIGPYNTAVGSGALQANTTGSGSTAIGFQALISSNGNSNIGIGLQAGYATNTGTLNVIIGGAALFTNTTGSRNTAIGVEAGYSGTFSGGLFLGYRAGYFENTSNKFYIDNDARNDLNDARSRSLVYGVFDAVTSNQYFNVNGNLFSSVAVGVGEPNTNGSWRMRIDSNDLIFEKRVAGTWTEFDRILG